MSSLLCPFGVDLEVSGGGLGLAKTVLLTSLPGRQKIGHLGETLCRPVSRDEAAAATAKSHVPARTRGWSRRPSRAAAMYELRTFREIRRFATCPPSPARPDIPPPHTHNLTCGTLFQSSACVIPTSPIRTVPTTAEGAPFPGSMNTALCDF